MTASWTADRLRSLTHKQLEALYANAKTISSPQAKHIIDLITEQHLIGLNGRATRSNAAFSGVDSVELARGHVNSRLKPWTQYQQVIVENYQSTISGTTTGIHVRPVKGENFPQTMQVECSRDMRQRYPVGTRFRIRAKVVEKASGNAFLYTHFDWPYEVIEES